MKTAKPIYALFYSIPLCILLVACNSNDNDPLPLTNAHSLIFIEEENELHVKTLDNNLTITFNKEDFNEYLSEFNLKKTLLIEKLPFKCQKDEFFSNNIWIIKPDNLNFNKEIILTVKYTHEEFAPEFNINDLRIYKLKREFNNSGIDDKEQLLIRVTDMSLLDHCTQNNDQMHVSTKITGFGGFVLGRVVQ